ncbi:methylated-DNA--[protein]-cysteine S-methyltransferase [Flavobacterium sp. J27]|uniref:bifunctional helix-turn-helix domain-containing protein/methylated-DNA--[protein]-cysteine S-methyltransferase n=1 Tax=Flavobacterium sp. J27 TaxID=2060419 RepID=UPI0010326581|nr:methylated-DNA--[protein]-cysteine S-methyltransferase [Flavobacterium sp. J27]
METNYHFEIIAKAIQFINSRQTEQPSLDEMANHVHLSKFHFQRVFRKWVGISPKDYLQYITLEKAKEALRKGQSTIETAFDVGLTGNNRLHDLFLKIEACTPGEFKKRGENVTFYTGTISTPFGDAFLIETQKGISSISFDQENIKKMKSEYTKAQFINELSKNGILVQNYFNNWKMPSTPICLDLVGTPFQIQVWKALLHIPSSNLLAYQDVAQMINNPKAIRAVGTAIGKNPIAYLIPCHRVIQNNGNMGNYHWGTERKIAINSFENIKLSE